MTSREARTSRRAAERKANKLENKRTKAADLNPDCKGGVPNTGFVSQAPSTRPEINRGNSQHSTGRVTVQGEEG